MKTLHKIHLKVIIFFTNILPATTRGNLRKYEWQSTSLYWCYVSNVQNNANQPKNPQNFVIKNLFKIMPKKEIHLSFTFLILKVVKEFRKSWDRNTT